MGHDSVYRPKINIEYGPNFKMGFGSPPYVLHQGAPIDPTVHVKEPNVNKHQYDGIYQAQPGMRFWGRDHDGKYVGVEHPKRYSFQYEYTDPAGTDWYRVKSGDLNCVVKVNEDLLPGKPTCYVNKVGDLEPVEGKHQHDGRYRAKPGYQFCGYLADDKVVKFAHPAEFELRYANTDPQGVDWYRVTDVETKTDQVVKILYSTILATPPSGNFERLSDLADESGKPDASKHQHDGRYRARRGCRLYCEDKAGNTALSFDEKDREFTFTYQETDSSGIDWYRVVGADKDCLVRVSTGLLPPSIYVDRVEDVKPKKQESPARFDGTYRVLSEQEHWRGHDPQGNYCPLRIGQGETFTFRYCGCQKGKHTCEISAHGETIQADWTTGRSTEDFFTTVIKSKLNSVVTTKVSDSTVLETKMPEIKKSENPARFDGTYRVKPGYTFAWTGKNLLGGYCRVIVKPEETFTFRYCSTEAVDRHVFEVQAHDLVVQGEYTGAIANLVNYTLSADHVVKISDSTVLEAKMPDHDARSKFDGTYQVKPGGSFKWHGQGGPTDVGPGGYFTFRHVADDRYEIKTNATTVVGAYFGVDSIVKENGSCCWLRPSNVTKISDSTEWDSRVNLPWSVEITTPPAPVHKGLTAAEQLLQDFGLYWVENGTKGVLAQCFKCHDTVSTTYSMVVSPDGSHSCALCGVKGTRLEDLAAAIKAHRAQGKPTVQSAPSQTRFNGTYRVQPGCTFRWVDRDGVVILRMNAGETFTVELLDCSATLGWYKYHVNGSGIDCRDTAWRRSSIEPYLACAEKISDSILPFGANTSQDTWQKDDTMDTTNIKQAFTMTNHKALAAVKTGAEQAGAHQAHEVVIAQVEKLLGAKFPREFYGTEIGRAVISMGSAYALLLTTQMVQHPLASKANHVAALALTAATYESAGPLLAKAREFVEGTVVAALGAGVDLESK